MRKGSWTRTALGLRSAVAALLAVGAAVLAVDLADWRYVRVDLTRSRSNTLDPALLDLIDQLPNPVVVDVFLRPLQRPYDGVSLAAADRVLEFLTVVHNARRERVDVRVHDAKAFEETQDRLRELGTEGSNKIVITCGERHDELELFGELCIVDWGNPSQELLSYLAGQGITGIVDPRWQPGRTFRPASLGDFRGDELFAQSLRKVSAGTAPVVYFAKGHGEPALDGTTPTDVARMRSALERDGFAVREWDALKSPSVPEDCAVLALIGPKQPYQESTRAAVKTWTEAGGRLVAAPELNELEETREGGVVDMLRDFGVVTRPGIVCQPFVGFDGEKRDGARECAWLVIDERGFQSGHPLTEPLRQRGRRVQFTLSPSFEGGGYQSDTGLLLPLVTSPPDSWRDLGPDYDFRFDTARGEKRDRLTLVTAKQLTTLKNADGSVRQGRLVAVASAYFFENESLDENRDFILNAFNWLADREYRIAVRPLARDESYVDFERSSAKPALSYTLWLGLPGLCAGIGLVVFLRRRS